MTEDSESNYSHRIFKNDPIKFRSFINKRVSVIAKDSSVHEGILYTVDPVSERLVDCCLFKKNKTNNLNVCFFSIILITPENEGKYRAKMIVGHSVDSMEIKLSTNDPQYFELPDFFEKKRKPLSEDELMKKKEMIKSILIENRCPVVEREKGVLIIQETLSIQPPYDPEDCLCSNPIILARIKKILSHVSTG